MLTKLLAGKPLLILILATNLVSLGAGITASNIWWDRKYTKYELSITQEKVKFLDDTKREQAERFDKYTKDYTAALAQITEVIISRDSAVEASNQKYRSLYAAYTKLQNAKPSTPESDIDPERSAMLLQSVYQANETRNEFAASRFGKTEN